MPKRIYVGNLPFSASEEEIRAKFGRFGKVVGVEIGRGTAVVDMADDASARRAISALHQTNMGGKSLNVNEARPRPR
jgi:RNA recognition motif-containing protein